MEVSGQRVPTEAGNDVRTKYDSSWRSSERFFAGDADPAFFRFFEDLNLRIAGRGKQIPLIDGAKA